MTDSYRQDLLSAHIVPVDRRRPDGVVHELVWHATVGDGPDAAGAAGLASLITPEPGLRLLFDYADPRRLLGLTVPCGERPGRAPSGGPLDPVALSPLATAILDRVVGTETRRRLESGGDPASAYIDESPSWLVAGRLALIQTRLRERRQPLLGLQAAVSAALLRPLASTPEVREWAAALAADAAPAARLLPADLVTYRDVAALLSPVLAACRHLQPDTDFGFVDQAIRLVEEADVLAQLQEWAETLEMRVESARAPRLAGSRTRGMPVMRGEVPGMGTHEAWIDHTLGAQHAQATWRLSDGRIEVRLTRVPAELPRSMRTRVTVLVTDEDSRTLLAASTSVAEEGSGEDLTADLPVPLSVAVDNLTVVVGRHLPVDPMTLEQFDRRQAQAKARSSLDRRWPEPLVRAIGDHLDRRQLKEQAETSVDHRRLSGARDLAWDLQWTDEAAHYEWQRLEDDGGEPELSIEESDRLIDAYATSPLEDAGARAAALDEHASAAYLDLIT